MKKFHFIAIGGAVMHNLALELHAHGFEITGSDDEIFDPARTRLEKTRLLPASLGWFPEKIHSGLDGIILGMHARSDNPELEEARRLGIKVYSFPEYIYEHSKNKQRVVIGGSHGKTTSTAMLMHVLRALNIDFDYLVGSQLEGFDRMVKLSNAPIIVIEGDEYLTSTLDPVPKFHRYHPHVAMLTGIAWDHINVFPTFENYVDQFKIFISTLLPEGKYFWFKHDVELQKLAAVNDKPNQSYEAPNYSSTASGTEVLINGESIPLSIFGKHNLENAAGVCLLAQEMGISENKFWKALSSFSGTAKRLEKVHESDQITVFRDFAHAPSKVRASVSAVREQYPNHHFIAVFELHTYSSLRADFVPEYHGAFDSADDALVLYDPHVYELKKMPVPDKDTLQQALGEVWVTSDPLDLKQRIQNLSSSTSPVVLLLMSSGNLGGINTEEFYL